MYSKNDDFFKWEKGKCVPKHRSIVRERKELPFNGTMGAIRYLLCWLRRAHTQTDRHREVVMQVHSHSERRRNLVLCLSDYISDARAALTAQHI